MTINWIELFIGFGFSMLGSAIVMLVAYLWKFRYLVEKSNYKNQKSAENRIIKDIKSSSTLRVYAMCGSTFSDTTENQIAKETFLDKKLKQKYLVSSNDNHENIEKRQNELPQKKGDKTLQDKIKDSIKNFEKLIKFNENNRAIKYHRNKVGFRLIICDKCLYLSHQEKGKYGKETKIQRIEANTPLYINFSEYFDELWSKY